MSAYTFSLFSYMLIDVYNTAISWLMWIMLQFQITVVQIISSRSWLYLVWIHTQGWGCCIIWQFYFQFSGNCHALFHTDCTILQTPPIMSKSLNFYASLTILAVIKFFTIASLRGVKWYFIVVLICISLMTDNLFTYHLYILAIYMISSEKCLFKILSIFWQD